MVKKGEDLGGIAFMYHLSVEALMAANPTVQPNLMSVGTTLVIPPSKSQAAGEKSSAPPGSEPETPTPIPVEAGRLTCTRVEDGGVWCFLPVCNTRSFALEGLSAVFRLADNQGKNMLAKTAFLPLDTLPAGVSLPLAAYFSPDQAARLVPPYQFSSEMLSALPSANDGRYLTPRVENSQVYVAEDGLSAAVSADVILKASEKET